MKKSVTVKAKKGLSIGKILIGGGIVYGLYYLIWGRKAEASPLPTGFQTGDIVVVQVGTFPVDPSMYNTQYKIVKNLGKIGGQYGYPADEDWYLITGVSEPIVEGMGGQNLPVSNLRLA
jgi:hypothetical protein